MKNKAMIALLSIFLFSCESTPSALSKENVVVQDLEQNHSSENNQNATPKKLIQYHLVNTKEWLLEHEKDSAALEIAYAINRTDRTSFLRMDSVVVPMDGSFDKADYLPFPKVAVFLQDVEKIIFFSYPTQTFAAYECGKLLYTGPTNMGREDHLTPTGLFFTNWKAKTSVSTVDDSWILHWNFNIVNQDGIGFHQYSLPGYPASHSCLRLQENDAYLLYNWADQWVLLNATTIKVKGTPVIIFGSYDFSISHPWRQLIDDPHGMDLSETELQKVTQDFLPAIFSVQKSRQALNN